MTSALRLRQVSIRALLYLILVVGLAVALGPIVWTLASSFKDLGEIFDYPPHLLPHDPTTANYGTLVEEFPIWRWIANSFLVALVATILGVFLCAMGGFGFAKYQFRGKNVLFGILLSSMMIPFAVLLIPLFRIVAELGWVNTYQALVIPWLAPAFGVFMMRQFITQAVPDEMLDAGRMDGATEFGLFVRLVLPIIRPAIAALSIWLFLTVYNAFLWPLVVLSETDQFTLPLGLNSILNSLGTYNAQYGVLLGGAVIAMAPTVLLFVALRKQFIEGLTLGSVKG